MRKFLAAAAAVLLSMAFAAPAEAATAGQRCTTKLAIEMSGSAKLYCGANTSKATMKARPLVWKKNAMCYDGVIVIRENQKTVTDTEKQLADLNAQLAALPSGASTDMLRTSLISLSEQLAEGVKDLKAGQTELRNQLRSYCK